jgi:lipoate-protein ligase A
MSKTWRFLDYSSKDPKTDWAVNEAIFRSRREGLTPDTLRLWHGSSSVVLGAHSSYENDVNHKACKRYDIQIVRVNSISAEVLYYDMGSLNLTFALDASCFKHLIRNYQPVLSEYEIINESIAKGLHRFDVNLKADAYGVYIDDRRIFEALPLWFYDFLLFQGTLHINTNLNLYEEVIRTRHFEKKVALTSLSRELGKDVPIDEVKKALLQGIKERLNVSFVEHSLTNDELNLAQKLYRIKYGVNKWNIDGKEPFLIGMGKTAVEVFVAYPPTSMCRKLIDMVKSVTLDLKDKVEVMIWMRGRGIQQHGPRPEMSDALRSAEKRSIIPAVIINGELKFEGSIPSKEDLRKAILDACNQGETIVP